MKIFTFIILFLFIILGIWYFAIDTADPDNKIIKKLSASNKFQKMLGIITLIVAVGFIFLTMLDAGFFD